MFDSLGVDTAYYILLGLWFLSFLRVTLRHIYEWQRCEYRVDRMREFLSTGKGKKFFFNSQSILKVFFFVQILYIIFQYSESFAVIVLLIEVTLVYLIVQLGISIYALAKHTFYRPKPTIKALCIFVSCLLAETYLVFFTPGILAIIFLEFVRPILVFSLVVLWKPITYFLKQRKIRTAKHVMQNKHFQQIIGITGSFGKTSMKEYITHLLQGKYTVLSTPKHVNTDIGIAQTVIANQDSHADIFVVEMGAYKKGEIKACADIVKPTIGVLTGINQQHIALFGSQRNIFEGKFELLTGLSVEGIAILNGTIEYPEDLLARVRAQKMYYTEQNAGDMIIAYACREKDAGYELSLEYGKEKETFLLPLPGMHNVLNFMGAALTCLRVGMNLSEIAKQAVTLPIPEGSLTRSRGMKNALIIDDSYNGNFDGFRAALDVLKSAKGKRKIVITQGILELGKESEKVHMTLGIDIAKIADICIVTREDAYLPILRGTAKQITVLPLYTLGEIKEFFTKELTKDDVVLVENRMPGDFLNFLKKTS